VLVRQVCQVTPESKWVGNLGKYPVTAGIWPGVFMPESLGGLDPSHLTLASRLSKFGYRTGHIGKWHLGVGEHQKYLPTRLSIYYDALNCYNEVKKKK
jgi:arylsulfatase A-like enzyme